MRQQIVPTSKAWPIDKVLFEIYFFCVCFLKCIYLKIKIIGAMDLYIEKNKSGKTSKRAQRVRYMTTKMKYNI